MGFPRRAPARLPIHHVLIGLLAAGLALPATALSTVPALATAPITLLNHSYWTEPFPGGATGVHIVGQVQNTTAAALGNAGINVSWIRVNVNLFDARPNDSSYTYATVAILGPGEVSPFELDLLPQPAGYTGYSIGAITYIPAIAQPYHTQPGALDAHLTTPVSTCPQGGVPGEVCGTVTNTGPNTVDNVKAILTYRDNTNTTVAQEHPMVQNASGGTTLGHNEVGSFDFLLDPGEPVGTNTPLILAEPDYPLDVNPEKVDFGSVNHGKTGQQTVTLLNTGTQTISFSSIQAAPSPEFTASADPDCPPAGLDGGASCHLTVKFTPAMAGTRTGTLTLTDTAAGSQQVIPLSGKGTAPAVAFDSAALDFGRTVRAGGFGAKTATLSNTGDGPLSITGFASDDPVDFSVDGSGCLAAPFTLPANSSCPIVVSFHPQIGGPYGNLLNSNRPDANLVVTDDAGSGTQKLPLQGVALGPGALLTLNGQPVRSIDFGDQLQAFTGAPAVVTLMNNGTDPLTISKISAGGDFNESDNCPGLLAALRVGGVCPISITFTPSQLGPSSGTLTITDNAGNGTQSITLTGNGVSGLGYGRRADSGVDRQRIPPATIVIRRR